MQRRVSLVLLFCLVCSLVCGCRGSSKRLRPPYIGVFVRQDRTLLEIPKTLGGANGDLTQAPVCSSTKPEILIWYPEVDLDLLTLIREPSGEVVQYQATIDDEGILSLTVVADLPPGVYSLRQGDWMAPQRTIPYWTFRVGEGDAATGQSDAQAPGTAPEGEAPEGNTPSEEVATPLAAQVTTQWTDQAVEEARSIFSLPQEVSRADPGWRPFALAIDVTNTTDRWLPVTVVRVWMTDSGGYERPLIFYHGSTTGQPIVLPPGFAFRIAAHGFIPENQDPGAAYVETDLGLLTPTVREVAAGDPVVPPLNEAVPADLLAAEDAWLVAEQDYRTKLEFTGHSSRIDELGAVELVVFPWARVENTGGYDLQLSALRNAGGIAVYGFDQYGFVHDLEAVSAQFVRDAEGTVPPGDHGYLSGELALPSSWYLGYPEYANVVMRLGAQAGADTCLLYRVETLPDGSASHTAGGLLGELAKIVSPWATSLSGAPVRDVSRSQDGSTLIVTREGRRLGADGYEAGEIVARYNLPDMRLEHTFWLVGSGGHVAVSPDGSRMAVVLRHEDCILALTVVDATDGEVLSRLDLSRDCTFGQPARCDWAPDGSALLCAVQRSYRHHDVLLWDGRSSQAQTLRENGGLTALAWSPDGSLVAMGSTNTTIEVWETGSWEVVDVLSTTDAEAEDRCSGLASDCYPPPFVWSDDGRYLAITSRDGAMIWDATTREVRTLPATAGLAGLVALSPDGTLLATGGGASTWDNTPESLKIWDVASGDEVASLAYMPANSSTTHIVWLAADLVAYHVDRVVYVFRVR